MIIFPNDLTPLPKYPGYFWSVSEEKLYSIKIGGVLRPLALNRLHPAVFKYKKMWNGNLKPGDAVYYISYNGKSKIVPVKYLKTLKLCSHVIPIERG